MSNEALSNLLTENRTFPPSEDFAANANEKADAYQRAELDREGFWAEQAERLSWDTKWS
ncbi:acetyl-coenzyme A synthetase N-terminal domain-containing protein, partial [Amycolatopsis alkalitolerans]